MKAPKLIKIAVLVLIVLILISLLIHLIGYQDNIFDIITSSQYFQDLQEVNSESLSPLGINSINMDITSADIRFILNDSDQIRIVQKATSNLNKDELLKISENNNIINIKQPVKLRPFFFFNWRKQTIDVYLPSSYNNNLSITSISGDIAMDNNFTLNDIYINQTSGDLNIADLNVINFKRESVSGDLKCNNLICNDYFINGTSGDIKIDALSGKGDIKNISGDIKINYTHITSNTNIEAVSGDISLVFSDNTGLDIRAKTVSGEIKTSFTNNLSGSFGKKMSTQIGSAPYYLLDLETVSGDISLASQ